ncbi:hypothetical protein L195_g002740 [Trifolium pratense]|uniref:Uncharacterized protein n=1 Tax=Trifolium pratense TaxID=57577 RepID=A0A2K3NTC1_TRIPR|nr:hypothetical protein L195_g002740 [Trifolium pratense]
MLDHPLEEASRIASNKATALPSKVENLCILKFVPAAIKARVDYEDTTPIPYGQIHHGSSHQHYISANRNGAAATIYRLCCCFRFGAAAVLC